MGEFLVPYRDSIDEDLLSYLDHDQKLSVPTVRRMRTNASAVLAGEVSPVKLMEGWEDWFSLAMAFAAACGDDELEG